MVGVAWRLRRQARDGAPHRRAGREASESGRYPGPPAVITPSRCAISEHSPGRCPGPLLPLSGPPAGHIEPVTWARGARLSLVRSRVRVWPPMVRVRARARVRVRVRVRVRLLASMRGCGRGLGFVRGAAAAADCAGTLAGADHDVRGAGEIAARGPGAWARARAQARAAASARVTVRAHGRYTGPVADAGAGADEGFGFCRFAGAGAEACGRNCAPSVTAPSKKTKNGPKMCEKVAIRISAIFGRNNSTRSHLDCVSLTSSRRC